MRQWLQILFVLSIISFSANAQQVGDPAPDFTHNTLQHGQITLSDYQGRVVYLYLFDAL